MLGRRSIIATCLIGLSATMAANLPAKADSFSDSFHDSCVKHAVSSMTQKGVKADAQFQKMTNDYCDCGLAGVRQQFTMPELQALMSPNPDPALLARVKPIMLQCYKENFQQ
jgi:hypothetical protein